MAVVVKDTWPSLRTRALPAATHVDFCVLRLLSGRGSFSRQDIEHRSYAGISRELRKVNTLRCKVIFEFLFKVPCLSGFPFFE